MADWRKVLKDYKGASEETPFGPQPFVYKTGGKIFAILSANETPQALSLKCDPFRGRELRSIHAAIAPGYHLNKQHWNTLTLDNTLDETLVKELIDHSYDLIVASLPKKLRESL